jgi:hypothetical protein
MRTPRGESGEIYFAQLRCARIRSAQIRVAFARNGERPVSPQPSECLVRNCDRDLVSGSAACILSGPFDERRDQ